MEVRSGIMSKLLGTLASFLRRCIFCILSIGPIPSHLAFIMDGNRRFAKRENLKTGAGHRAGFLALMPLLKYCYELGVKYVTVYAFSIDNFKRRPDELQILMDLVLEKSEGLIKEESVVNEYGVRVCFSGNLKLLSEPVQAAIEKVMRATANNSKCVLLVCLAYTSTDEIRHAVQESCKDKWNQIESSNSDKACYCEIEEVDNDKKIDSAVMNGFHESLKDGADKSHLMNALPECNGLNKRVGGPENRNGNGEFEEVDDDKKIDSAVMNGVHESFKDEADKSHLMNILPECNGLNKRVGRPENRNGSGEFDEVDDDKKIDGAVMNGVHESFKDEADKSHLMNARPVCNGVTKKVGGAENRNGIQEFFGDKFDEAQSLEATRNGNSVIPVEKFEKMQSCSSIKLVDIEKHMYMGIAPDPDILIRTAGENRLSNFLLWQTSYCPLYSPEALWPEIGLWQVIWATLIFQRYHSYLEKKKKQL